MIYPPRVLAETWLTLASSFNFKNEEANLKQ